MLNLKTNFHHGFWDHPSLNSRNQIRVQNEQEWTCCRNNVERLHSNLSLLAKWFRLLQLWLVTIVELTRPSFKNLQGEESTTRSLVYDCYILNQTSSSTERSWVSLENVGLKSKIENKKISSRPFDHRSKKVSWADTVKIFYFIKQ